ncbi:acyltransferase [Colwellia sp. E2M01]|uniref:acyltransferase family protein n=1 Tax=Colwellia sp. E2M01 TaxID=2841561 RepID=UPI001C08DD23|nr:acyltransferase [Colwellia sp. E2M01]MBU2870034.1 acyltransferase [Colwellia sp. E2M01]
MYLHSLNNLRALSIILIVFNHTFWVSNWHPESVYSGLYKFLLMGGTFYFLFISGFLFNHLSVENFSYSKFIKQKIRTVISPYIFLSIFPIIVAVTVYPVYPEYFFTIKGQGIWLEYIKPAILYFLSGRVLTGYWYIPFIALVFILSPLFVKYSKFTLKNQLLLLGCLIIISGFTHRATDNMNPFQAVVYLIPMFMFGMLCSAYNTEIKKISMGYVTLLILGSTILSVYQLVVLNIPGNLSKEMFTYAGFDLRLIEKGMQILGVYLLFERFCSKDIKFISLIASSSFAIYFLHSIVIFVIKRVVPANWEGFLYWHLLTICVVGICILIAWILKKILGHKSRYIIGW